MESSLPTIEERRRIEVISRRLTPQEIIGENIRIYAENNIKNLDDLNAYTLKERLANKENSNENK
jgi:hypothetical protein